MTKHDHLIAMLRKGPHSSVALRNILQVNAGALRVMFWRIRQGLPETEALVSDGCQFYWIMKRPCSKTAQPGSASPSP